ncbi:AMP-binding protein, partial [Pseudomonas gingeri]|uniref:AMP-binding protein n=1 Tax=Pseudomonas gingeri TaxID=117681 RepID=UPI0015B89C9B
YTSGSTGVPKGVVIDHAGAVNTLLDINRRFAVGPRDRVLAVSSLSFDLSVYDFFGTLAAGAAVVLLDHRQALDPLHWRELIERHRVSLWNSVPALLGLLLESVENQGGTLPASLRLAMLSGDWIALNLADRARALQPAIEVISLGGATEASIWSICYPIGEVDPAWRSIPYGKALDHQRFHVLDEALQQRPTWVPGQLYIGGVGLAKGYWRDEVQSAASFFAHPLTGERLYRTGD